MNGNLDVVVEFDGDDNAAEIVVAVGPHAEKLEREVDLRVRGDRDGRPRQGCQRRVHFFFMGSPAGPGAGGSKFRNCGPERRGRHTPRKDATIIAKRGGRLQEKWRRERDSNPRYLAARRFSRPML